MIIFMRDSKHPSFITTHGVGRVVKCETRRTKNGSPMWTAFLDFDFEYQQNDRCKERVMKAFAFSYKDNDNLASKLIAWPKGTLLSIDGIMELDNYWTQRSGKETYVIRVTHVHDQHDYANAVAEANGSNIDFNDQAGGDPGGYDPGF